MTSLGSLIILLAAAFFIYPLAANRTTSECVALGRHVGMKATAHVAANPEAGGLIARGIAIRDLPQVPAPAGCAWLYWRSIVNDTQP